MNKILMTDSYKLSHFNAFDSGIENMHYYIEARGGRWNRTVFFGLQMILKSFFNKQFTKEELEEAKAVAELHMVPFNYDGWKHIIEKHNGYLPLEIRAVDEGTVLPTSNVLLTVENTDPECYWLPGYIETVLLRAIWYPTTVATQGFFIKKLLTDFLNETGDPSSVVFKLHDFGARSSKSSEAAAIGGCAHLVNFRGTDTLEGVLQAKKFYDCEMAGFSIPALEHSVVMSFERDNESNAYKKFMNVYSESNVKAMVVDTYDLYNTLENIIGKELKDLIVNRSGSTIVIRPDSGNPVATSTNTINKLMEAFGYQINEKGYKVLPPYVRVIHGDGISFQSLQDIIFEMKAQKLSGDNIAFGMGSKLLDQLDRDNLSFAMKCSAIKKNGKIIHVQKDPATDHSKKSKTGILSLVRDGNTYKTITGTSEKSKHDILKSVFKNGEILKEHTLDEIRARVDKEI